MEKYNKHVFVCIGSACTPGEESSAIYKRLKEQLAEKAPDTIRRSKSQCLGVCEKGPLLVVYPEGIWYSHVDQALLDRIVDEHLIGGKPVKEHIFHNNELAVCSADSNLKGEEK